MVSIDGAVLSADLRQLIAFPSGNGGDYVILEGVTSVSEKPNTDRLLAS